MRNNSIRILVEVRSGIPLSVKTFSNEAEARKEEIKLRKKLNLENAETGIFEVSTQEE